MCSGFLGDVFRIGATVAAVAVAAVTLNPFAIVAAVGAVASTVGYYTKSKELQIGGSILGAIGAIGGLANAAGVFSLADIGMDAASTGLSWGSEAASATSSFGASGAGELGLASAGAPAAEMTVDTMPNLVSMAGDVSVPGVGAGELGGVAAATAPDVTPAAALSTGAGEGLTPSVGMVNQPMVTASGSDSATLSTFGDPSTGAFNAAATSTPVTGATVPTAPAAPTTPAPAVTGSPFSGADAGVPGSFNAAQAQAAAFGPATGPVPSFTPAAADPTIWSKMWSFLEKPGGAMLGYGALQAGSAFLAGATSELTPAQVEALKAQAQANQAAANLSRQQASMLQQQQANMNERLPVATRTRGMINRPLAPVTGAPA